MIETILRVVIMMSSAVIFVVIAVLVMLKGTTDVALATVRAVIAPARRRIAAPVEQER